MIQRADTIGVFQIESRAQMSMLPRLQAEKFYDLVIEVAIVRPGPIQGNMVHPYLRRRENPALVTYPAPRGGNPDELKEVLEKTLGVPLFQEQAMRIAIVGAGFQPGEADRLRRAMATFKRVGTIGTFRDKFINGMTGARLRSEIRDRCFEQIEGFGGYGFPESHAASFANLVYASAWMKCHYPDVFAAALLNSQPMGFYATAQTRARRAGAWRRGAAGRCEPSDWDCTLEEGGTARASTASAPRRRCSGDIATDPCAASRLPRRSAAFPRSGARKSKACAAAASIPCAISGCAPACRRSAGEACACRRFPFARPRTGAMRSGR